ncbi:MAG TPA: cell division protein FtsL [Burkholderiaceae bacterium]|nr:cell division protein FtsL [Burkholderiaceae bacterium]
MRIGHLVLAVAVVVSALSLVTSQQRARHVFVELERARDEQRRLDQQWAQLQLEQTAWGKHSLIEQTARQQLGMRPVTPDRTQYMNAAEGKNTKATPGGAR